MSLLLQAPTIESLAEVLQPGRMHDPVGRSWWPFNQAARSLHSSLSRGVGGNVLIFARLAKQLGHEQPVYGLQARGLDGEAPPFTRVEEMAALYVQEICAVRPKGPYLIGGTCTGGVVAYEMAQQLVGRGEQVILARSWKPGILAPIRPTAMITKNCGTCLSVSGLPTGEGKLGSIKNLLKREWFHNSNLEDYTDLVASATLCAVSHYHPKPYPGCLLNVIASTRPLSHSTQDTRLAWSELALTGDQTVFMPAEDSGRLFVSPHVQELAHHLVAHFNHESS